MRKRKPEKIKNETLKESAVPPVSEAGLSAPEAEAHLQQYGFNEISEKKTHPILKFLSFFWGRFR